MPGLAAGQSVGVPSAALGAVAQASAGDAEEMVALVSARAAVWARMGKASVRASAAASLHFMGSSGKIAVKTAVKSAVSVLGQVSHPTLTKFCARKLTPA